MGGALNASFEKSKLHTYVLSKLGVDPEQLAELRPDPVELPGRSVMLRALTRDDEVPLRELVQRNLGDLLAAGLVLEDTVDDDAVPAIITAETCDLGYVFGIFRESQLIGEVSLSGVVRGNRQTAFLSLWVDADVRGEGVAEEAYVLLVGHAFDNLDLHRVEVAALPDNDAVIRALEKVGVESRGTDPRSVRIGGEWRDHERYVFTAEDWTKRGDELRSQFT